MRDITALAQRIKQRAASAKEFGEQRLYVEADSVLALLDELETVENQLSALFAENVRLKAGIYGLVHLGIRHHDIDVMKLAGDAQLSTPCTDGIIELIAAGAGKGEAS